MNEKQRTFLILSIDGIKERSNPSTNKILAVFGVFLLGYLLGVLTSG